MGSVNNGTVKCCNAANIENASNLDNFQITFKKLKSCKQKQKQNVILKPKNSNFWSPASALNEGTLMWLLIRFTQYSNSYPHISTVAGVPIDCQEMWLTTTGIWQRFMAQNEAVVQ